MPDLFSVSSRWRWLCHWHFLLWHLCSRGERTRPARFPSVIVSVTCDHHTDNMICSLQMAVLEIQANGDSVVSKEAIVNAGHSLEDPLMRVSVKNTLHPRYTASQQGWLFYALCHVTDKIQNNVIILCRSSPSPVYAMKPSSVQQLTTFCSTECCSRSTPSNCSPPTASSTTSVSFSPPPDEHSAAISPLSMPALFLTGTKHNVNLYGNIFRGI